jgi:hypothetical protein
LVTIRSLDNLRLTSSSSVPAGTRRADKSIIVPDYDGTVDAIPDAIRERAPQVLAELRDGPKKADAALEWARRHYLDTPKLVDAAERLLEVWARYPKRAQRLERNWISVNGIGSSPSRAERQWRKAMLANDETLPFPHLESLNQWLERAAEMYRQIEAIALPSGKRLVFRDPDPKHVEWFVDVQVRGLRPKPVADAARVDRLSVVRATDQIVKLLRLKRRRHGPGRPKK